MDGVINNVGENVQDSISVKTASSLSSNTTINQQYDCYVKKRLEEDYEEGDILGQGAFGRVVLAVNKTDHREYAIKMIATTKKVAARVENEINIISKLNHKNVVRYYGSWSENGTLKKRDLDASLSEASSNNIVFERENGIEENENDDVELSGYSDSSSLSGEIIEHLVPPKIIFIKMEYCKEYNLRKLIDSKDLIRDTKLLWKIFQQIVKGLEYIHSQKIIHGDIKPENIFLTNASDKCKYTVKIGDFGLSTSLIGRTQPPYVVGTLHYIAPERSLQKERDIYSLGIVLFEMFFHCLTDAEAKAIFCIEAGVKNTINFPKNFTENGDTRRLIASMLSYDYWLRPTPKSILESIPVTKKDTNGKYVINEFSKTRTHTFSHTITCFFCCVCSKESAEDQLYDVPPETFTYNNMIMMHQNFSLNMINELRNILLSYGLHERVGDIFTSYNYNPNTNLQIPVIDRFGRICTIATDLHQTFAKSSVEKRNFGSFAFGNFGSCKNDKEFPKQTKECSVDMMAPIQHAPLTEIFLSSLVVELLDYFSTFVDMKYTIYIGHAKLMEAIAELYCFREGLSSIRKKFSSFLVDDKPDDFNITNHEIDSIGTALSIREEDFNVFQKKFCDLKQKVNVKNKITNAITEMNNFSQKIIAYIKTKNMQIIFASGMSYKPEIFGNGLCFIVKASLKNGFCKKTSIIAGGRFDEVLAFYRKKMNEEKLFALGIDIFLQNIDKIVFTIKNVFFKPHVLIDPKNYQRDAVMIKNEFQTKKYPASLNLDGDVSVPELKDMCKADCIPYLLVITDKNKVILYADTRFAQVQQEPNDGHYYKAKMNYKTAVKFVISTTPKNNYC